MERIPVLAEKRVLLGVTGGIAAYKTCTLASRLTQAGAAVDVVMTEAGARFVAPLTYRSLTGRPVYTSLWAAGASADGGPEAAALPTHVVHVGLAEAAELMVIAPATANTLAKLAHGIADNLLTSLALAARCPLIVAPAMDGGMWANAATQANVGLLQERGVIVVGPATGRLASGLEGQGRMVEPEELVGHVRLALGSEGPLQGRHVVVSAGPTREAMDPVRFLKEFPDRIYHVHMKDAGLQLDGYSGILSSHLNFGDPKRGWDFRSLGHGGVNFEEIVRTLNQIGYAGPLSVEWEDSGMDREHGAKEACEFVRKVDFKPSEIAFDAAFDK